MSNNTAYDRMRAYKVQHKVNEHSSFEKKQQIEDAIKILSGFRNHCRQNLLREYKAVRKGDIDE